MKRQEDMHESIIREALHEAEREEHIVVRFFRRHGPLIGAIILGVLILSLSLPLNIIDSLLASKKGEEQPPVYVIDIGSGRRIVFDLKVYDTLLQAYFQEQRYEFKACLQGAKHNGDYAVDAIYFPEVISQTHTSVTAPLCDEQTIVDLHTHPYNSCIFSEVDVASIETVRRINPDAIIALMCAPDRFNVYGDSQG